MSVPRRIAAFLDLALEDVQAAEALAGLGNRYAAYHCQQAVEKLVKAVLLHAGIEAGIEHHLDTLVDRLPEGHPWKADLRPLDRYTPYATAYRYPTPGGRITSAPAKDQVSTDAATLRTLIARARRDLIPRA